MSALLCTFANSGTALVWGMHVHAHMRMAVQCSHRHAGVGTHAQISCVGMNVCGGGAGGLSLQPGPAQATDWHRAADGGLGTSDVEYEKLEEEGAKVGL